LLVYIHIILYNVSHRIPFAVLVFYYPFLSFFRLSLSLIFPCALLSFG
jgi:hypothetical protein